MKKGRPTNKQEADAMAEGLAKRLSAGTGLGWTAKVWNNLGWCYNASHGRITVHSTHNGMFHTLIASSSRHQGSGACEWSGTTYSANPVESVKMAIGHVKNYMLQIDPSVDQCEKMLESIEEIEQRHAANKSQFSVRIAVITPDEVLVQLTNKRTCDLISDSIEENITDAVTLARDWAKQYGCLVVIQ